MKKRRAILFIVILLLVAFAILCFCYVYNRAPKKPFSKLSEDDVAQVSIIYGTHEPKQLSDEEVGRFLELLRAVVIYEIDNGYDEWLGGYPGVFCIEKTNGKTICVRECATFFIINKTGFQAEYTPCEQLGDFFFEMKEKYIKIEF